MPQLHQNDVRGLAVYEIRKYFWEGQLFSGAMTTLTSL